MSPSAERERSYDLHGVRVLECLGDGTPPAPRDAAGLIGAAWGHKAKLIVLPAGWLGDDFFRQSTRVAGDVVQKLID